MKLLYKLYINNFIPHRNLYKFRNEDNSINVQVLSLFLLQANIFSITIFLLDFFDLSIISLFPEIKIPKSIFGYIFGGLSGVFFFSVADYLNKKLSYKVKYNIFRKALHRIMPKWFSITYIIVTFTFLTYVVFGILN